MLTYGCFVCVVVLSSIAMIRRSRGIGHLLLWRLTGVCMCVVVVCSPESLEAGLAAQDLGGEALPVKLEVPVRHTAY
jgi:hypothetical protein